MCGINGAFAYHYAANPIDREELARTRNHMAARGPDGRGEWYSSDGRVGFCHQRLSIIDLSDAAKQPMSHLDGALVVTFNGEIYNYQELRRALEKRGHVFRTTSDTEVLLHLYAEKGDEMVHDLRGMFAFAIWDGRRGEVFLARDPYGIKPLYYADDGWSFRFASQVRALLSGGGVSRDPEPAGVVGFYLWGSVPEPFTTYQAIRALPAGTSMRVDCLGAHKPRRFYSVAQVYCDMEEAARGRAAPTQNELQDRVRDVLLDSVKHHLIADVPVGAFLSAGIDSGALVGLMRDAGQQDIQTVTLAFDEFRGREDDEVPLAAEIARKFGTHHTTRVVSKNEFERDLPSLLQAMDQPSIDGINTWFVSKAAKELDLKVVVSGLGGDELFGSYPSFHDVPKSVSLMRWPSRVPGLGLAARFFGEHVGHRLGFNPKAAGILELGGSYAGAYLLRRGLFMPWELGEILEPDILRQGLRRLDPLSRVEDELRPTPVTGHGKVATLESTLYMRNQLLRDTDWASMAHSLEVRVPLVDSVLLRGVAALSTFGVDINGKALLAQAPANPLPREMITRPKTGFTTPIDSWMRTLSNIAPPRLRKFNPHTQRGHSSRQWALWVGANAASGEFDQSAKAR